MFLLLILLVSFSKATTPNGKGVTDVAAQRQAVMLYESTIIGYVYNIHNFQGNINGTNHPYPFEPLIVFNETQPLVFYTALKLLLEESYSYLHDVNQYTPETKEISPSVVKALSHLEEYMREYFFKFGRKNVKGSEVWRNGLDAGRIFAYHFGTDDEKNDAAEKANNFYALMDPWSSDFVNYLGPEELSDEISTNSSDEIDQELDRINEIFSLSLAHVLGGHSSNYHDVNDRISEMKQFGMEKIVKFRKFLEYKLGDILKKQRDTQGDYPTKGGDVLIKALFYFENIIRHNWQKLVLELKNCPIDLIGSEPWEQNLHTRLRYVRMFTDIDGLDQAKYELADISKNEKIIQP